MKRIIALICLTSMLVTLFSMVVFAEDTNIIDYHGVYNLRKVERDGIVWRLSDSVKGRVDTKGTSDADDDTYCDGTIVEQIGYVNEAGNIEASSKDTRTMIAYGGYGAYIRSGDNTHQGATFSAKNFTANFDFETRMKMREQLILILYCGKYRFYLNFYDESELSYTDENGESRSIELDIGRDVWHTWKLSVRNTTTGTICMDGKEVVTYTLPKSARAPEVEFRTYKHEMDSYNQVEIEYVTVTPVEAESAPQKLTTDGYSKVTEEVYQPTDEVKGEYILDYTYDGSENATVSVNDGYFGLDFIHSGNTISYLNEKGETETYTGMGRGIGAGDYKIVATAGYAEVYYNGQFAFSCYLNLNYAPKGTNYSKEITNFNLQKSGVKKERYFRQINGEEEIADYNMDFDKFYSAEFDKKDSSSETIVIYDGEYQAKLFFDEKGITAMSQFEDYEPSTEFRLCETVESGYYRLTVASGLAQLFRNNVYINSFKCPTVSHKDAVFRKMSNPSATTFIAIKDTDDIYFHSEDFEGNNEIDALKYFESEKNGLIVDGSAEIPFTQEIVTENGNSYLKISDTGLVKEDFANVDQSVVCETVGDFNLSMNADFPNFKWRAKTHSTSGRIHFIGRHIQKGEMMTAGYDLDAKQWFIKKYVRKQYAYTNDSGGTANAWYDSEETVATASGSIDANWHNYEMKFEGDSMTLLCDGKSVVSCNGLITQHGKVGFGVSGGASLCIDDIEYSGEGKASPGIIYLSQYGIGSKDFAYNPVEGGIIAGAPSYSSYITKDQGKTWEAYYAYPGSYTLNLLSGGYMSANKTPSGSAFKHMVYANYTPKYAYENGGSAINYDWNWYSYYKYNPYNFPQGYLIGNYDDYRDENRYSLSFIPSRLVQVQDGKYKGRVFVTYSVGSGERYGGEALYYTDGDVLYDPNDTRYWNGMGSKPSNKAYYPVVWTQSEDSFFYEEQGVNFQESLIVDMPDSVIRITGRSDEGFLVYADSYDGGSIFDELKPMQLISPRCSFAIVRDPNNLNHYYAMFEYEANTSDKQNDGGRPRTRVALAASYDAMKSWCYLADLEELTDNWKTSRTPQNHGMRIIDGVLYMSYSGTGGAYSKFFTMNVADAKPLKRFSEVHQKVEFYDHVAGNKFDGICVVPKTSGVGTLYGEEYTVSDGKTFATNAKAQGKAVSETAYAYVVAEKPQTRMLNHYFENMGVEKTFEQDEISDFLNSLNVAAENNRQDIVEELMNRYEHILGFAPDFSGAEPEDVYKKMTEFEYFTLENAKSAFKMSVKAANKQTDGIVMSTATEGRKDWTIFGSENSATATVKNDFMVVAPGGYDNSSGIYQNSAFTIPETESYTVKFDIYIKGNNPATVKWGNEEHKIHIDFNSGEEFGVKKSIIPVTVVKNHWNTITVEVQDNGATKNVIVCSQAEGYETVTENVFENVVPTSGVFGFGVEGSVQLKNIRIYKGKAFDVFAYSENEVIADFLNNGETITDNFKIYAASYDQSGRFLGEGSVDITGTIAPYETKRIKIEGITLNDASGGRTLKLFMWRNGEDLVPLEEAQSTVTAETLGIDISADFEGSWRESGTGNLPENVDGAKFDYYQPFKGHAYATQGVAPDSKYGTSVKLCQAYEKNYDGTRYSGMKVNFITKPANSYYMEVSILNESNAQGKYLGRSVRFQPVGGGAVEPIRFEGSDIYAFGTNMGVEWKPDAWYDFKVWMNSCTGVFTTEVWSNGVLLATVNGIDESLSNMAQVNRAEFFYGTTVDHRYWSFTDESGKEQTAPPQVTYYDNFVFRSIYK